MLSLIHNFCYCHILPFLAIYNVMGMMLPLSTALVGDKVGTHSNIIYIWSLPHIYKCLVVHITGFNIHTVMLV